MSSDIEAWTLTTRDVAKQVGVHPDTVRAWQKKGLIPTWKTPSGFCRYRQSDIDAFIALGRS